MALRNVDQAQADVLLNTLLDEGVNFIDTAPDYGPSEDLIGNAISNRRDEYFLATKCGCNVPPVEGPRHIWTGEQVRHNIEHSLKRLQTDYVDVWQVHSAYPEELAQTDVLETMLAIQEEGKVRCIAVSMAGASEGYGYVQLKGYLDWEAWEAIQIWYSAFIRHSEGLISRAGHKGWGTIVRGLVRPPRDATNDELFEAAGLDDLRDPEESRAQFLIRYGISHPDLDTAIVGTSSIAHLADNIRAVEAGPLADDVLEEAQHRLEAAGHVVGLDD
jgi:aryl-alcohol dehydrogenase-like predicted oxidoreductase